MDGSRTATRWASATEASICAKRRSRSAKERGGGCAVTPHDIMMGVRRAPPRHPRVRPTIHSVRRGRARAGGETRRVGARAAPPLASARALGRERGDPRSRVERGPAQQGGRTRRRAPRAGVSVRPPSRFAGRSASPCRAPLCATRSIDRGVSRSVAAARSRARSRSRPPIGRSRCLGGCGCLVVRSTRLTWWVWWFGCCCRGWRRGRQPENLLLDEFGYLKISDFGLSAM